MKNALIIMICILKDIRKKNINDAIICALYNKYGDDKNNASEMKSAEFGLKCEKNDKLNALSMLEKWGINKIVVKKNFEDPSYNNYFPLFDDNDIFEQFLSPLLHTLILLPNEPCGSLQMKKYCDQVMKLSYSDSIESYLYSISLIISKLYNTIIDMQFKYKYFKLCHKKNCLDRYKKLKESIPSKNKKKYINERELQRLRRSSIDSLDFNHAISLIVESSGDDNDDDYDDDDDDDVFVVSNPNNNANNINENKKKWK